MSESISFFAATGRDIRPVLGPGLPGDVLDDLLDLGLVDPGALHADGLGGAHRQEQGVALADQLVGAGLVEDDPGVGDAGDGEGEARRHVGLDQAGDDVDADGRWVASTRWIPEARASWVMRTIESSTSRGATIMRSASSSTTTSRYG